MPSRRLLATLTPLLALVAAARAETGRLERALELQRTGRPEEAVAAYREIVATERDPTALATARNNACSAANDLGRYREALADCLEAERLRRAAGGGAALADTLVNLGLALDSLGQSAEAERADREALVLYRAAGDVEAQALTLSNLASLAIGRGDPGAALALLDEEERLARNHAAEPWAEEELRVVATNRAVALERLGAYREALVQARAGAGLGAGDPSQAAVHALDVAVLYRNLGDPWRAWAELERAGELVARSGDRSAAATLALNRGLVRLLDLDQPEAAAGELRTALELARAAGDRREEGRVLCALARAELAAGRAAEAERTFAACLAVAEATDSAETRWTAAGGLGRAAAARGREAEAIARLGEAIDGLERAGAGVASAGLREGLIADQRALYAALVDLRAGRGEAAAALAVAERARARELLEALGGDAAAPLDAGALARLARTHGPFAAFFAGERRLWRFRLDRDGLAVADAGDAEALLADARAVAAALAARRAPDAERLARLARALVPETPAGGRLVVVPDGALFHLPFELLPDAAGRPLLERVALAYAPSLSVLDRLPRAPLDAATAPTWTVAAVADPRLGDAPPAGAAAVLAARFGLPPLPGAEREARAAAERLGGRASVALGEAATEAALARAGREGARLLLVAAHTLVDERLDGGAAIFLAPGEGEDGVVTPAELAGRPLAAGLAVLSGCRTALAGRRDGRSLATLAGALLGAGARGVVATLWEVPDRAAAALMDGFYWELARGAAPAEALRRAKLRLAGDARWAGRADWSAFVLIGDPPPLVAARRPWAWAAAGALSLAAGAALLARTRRRAR